MTLASVLNRRRGPASQPHAGAQLVGQRYRIDHLLGRGSEADVFHATDFRGPDAAGSGAAAVKVFRSASSDNSSPFVRERELHAPLHHANVVRIHGSGRMPAGGPDAGRDYIVAELAGTDLRQLLQGGPLPAAQTAVLLGGVAKALAHIHRRGIVHNDVKPANIMVAGNPEGGAGVAKLTDFGIATSAWHRPNAHASGTPHYLSPEAVHGRPTTGASDIYALGLVAFECLTGIKAFPGPALESMVARTLRSPRLPDTVRRRWSVLLLAMTDTDPATRPTAGETLRMLQRIGR